MITALWTASTGMEAQMTNLDVISHNIANANTVSFKKGRADFQDLLYQSLELAGSSTSADAQEPVGAQVGVGTKLAGIHKEFTTGSLQRTDRDLDVAIAGSGFIQVLAPDGTIAYTRDGAFKVSGEGLIVNSDGYTIADLGQIPANARSVSFGPTGKAAYMDENGQETTIGQMQLAMFINPSGLEAVGGNLYKMTDASGAPRLVNPGLEGAGTIQQHFLEMSNVSIVEEMVSMITTQRAYEINSKMIKAADEMLATANQIA